MEEQRGRREAIEARIRAHIKAIQASVAAAQDKARAKVCRPVIALLESRLAPTVPPPPGSYTLNPAVLPAPTPEPRNPFRLPNPKL